MGVKSGVERHQNNDVDRFQTTNIHKSIGKNWFTFSSFLEQFWLPFLGPILIPKLVQNLLIFGSILDPFFLGFRSSLGGLKSEKMQTVPRENHFFENVAFLVFEALVRKWVPKWSPKGIQKVTKKWSTKSSPMVQKMVDEIIKFESQHDKKSL